MVARQRASASASSRICRRKTQSPAVAPRADGLTISGKRKPCTSGCSPPRNTTWRGRGRDPVALGEALAADDDRLEVDVGRGKQHALAVELARQAVEPVEHRLAA